MSKRAAVSAPAEAPLALLKVKHDAKGRIYSPLRGLYLVETPEERVRQDYVCTLVNEYGYSLDQMAEEQQVGSLCDIMTNAASSFCFSRKTRTIQSVST